MFVHAHFASFGVNDYYLGRSTRTEERNNLRSFTNRGTLYFDELAHSETPKNCLAFKNGNNVKYSVVLAIARNADDLALYLVKDIHFVKFILPVWLRVKNDSLEGAILEEDADGIVTHS